MKRVVKIRCYPNKTQISKINYILGACRYVMNLYIEYERERYKKTDEFLTGYNFSKIINKLKKDPTSSVYWLCNVSSKALKDAIMTQEKAYKNYFKKIKKGEKCNSPMFKSRKKLNKESFFFIKDQVKFNIYDEYDNLRKNIIKIPILGKMRITGKNQLPNDKYVTSGRVIKEKDKYYLMFIYEDSTGYIVNKHDGFGIDLGIKYYATISNINHSYVKQYKHFKEYDNYIKNSNKIKYLRKLISNKSEFNYGKLLNKWMDEHPNEKLTENYKNIMKGASYNTSNIMKLNKKVSRLYTKLINVCKDYINKLVYELVVRTKPLYITIEDLDISEMLENDSSRKLHDYIHQSAFYMFRMQLINKCESYNTELRLANKYFPSSKMCYKCGNINKNLRLSDRVYKCSCGNHIDRDINAAFNLVNLSNKFYNII